MGPDFIPDRGLESYQLCAYIFIPAKEHFNKRPLLCKLYKDFYIKI